jgi:DNA replication protein DnaC
MGQASVSSLEERQRAKFVRRAGIPQRLVGKRMGDLTIAQSVRVACDAMVERMTTGGDPIGQGILLHGGPGRGKTTIAVAALIEALYVVPREMLGKEPESDAMRPGYYSTYTELVHEHKTSWGKDEEAEVSEDLLRSLYGRQSRGWWNTRLLVLDDVGKEHAGASGFTVNTLHDLLRSRYDKALPTIITTNLEPEDFAHYGPAMASFIHEAFDIVEVSGKDRRR